MIQGSCLCGDIGFEIDPAGVAVAIGCYCTNCRKVSGGQAGVYLQVRSPAFRWLPGQDQVATYESSPGNNRGFCWRCGSIAPIATGYGAVRVPAGALDSDPGDLPRATIFAGDKAAWCEVDSDQAFTDAGPPDFWRKVVLRLTSP